MLIHKICHDVTRRLLRAAHVAASFSFSAVRSTRIGAQANTIHVRARTGSDTIQYACMHALSGARKAPRCYHRAKDAAGDAAPRRNRGMMGSRQFINFILLDLILIEPKASKACAKTGGCTSLLRDVPHPAPAAASTVTGGPRA